MKRVGSIISITVAMVLLCSSMVFAAEDKLSIDKTYPKDGQNNTSIENMSVKMHFNKDVYDKKNRHINDKAFSIIGDDGYKVPIRVMYNPKNHKEVMVVALPQDPHNAKKQVIKNDAKYTMTVKKSFTSDDGDTLSKDYKVKFQTMNQKRNTTVYMIMMVVMFGGMFFFTSRSARANEEKEEDGNTVRVNPYKEAKRTGKSVEEIIARDKKEKEKRAKKAAKRAERQQEEEVFEEELPPGHFRVKGPRPIKAAGGKTVSGTKAAAEKRRAQEEKWAKQAKKRRNNKR